MNSTWEVKRYSIGSSGGDDNGRSGGGRCVGHSCGGGSGIIKGKMFKNDGVLLIPKSIHGRGPGRAKKTLICFCGRASSVSPPAPPRFNVDASRVFWPCEKKRSFMSPGRCGGIAVQHCDRGYEGVGR